MQKNKLALFIFSILFGTFLMCLLKLTDGTVKSVHPYAFHAIIFIITVSYSAGLFILISWMAGKLGGLVQICKQNMENWNDVDVLWCVLGLFGGLMLSDIVTSPLEDLGTWGRLIQTAGNLFGGIIGTAVAILRKDFAGSLSGRNEKPGRSSGTTRRNLLQPKILDTSVIIDGRILDICRSGFIEGTLVIPGFVLEELRHIADSSDSLKRNRGRRGLDILNAIQNEADIEVEICDIKIEEESEVDIKLISLTKKLHGVILTNDYNLNKVAGVHKVPVLNINELANAVKPVVLPGEEMSITVIKNGKEIGQGVGYLNDGTMIVVEGGRKYLGETVMVEVTSILQTAAGRMIFAKPKYQVDKAV